MSTPGTEDSRDNPTRAERIMDPDNSTDAGDATHAGGDRSRPRRGGLRRHQRSSNEGDATSAASDERTSAGAADRDSTLSEERTSAGVDDSRADGDAGVSRDHGSSRDAGDDNDLDSTQAMPAYADDDSATSPYSRKERNDDMAGDYSRPERDSTRSDDLDDTRDGDDTGTRRRVTRDELYAREDRQGEQDRLARARAEHQAGAQTPSDTEPVPAPVATGKEKRDKPPRTTDKFVGAWALFVLRVITGVVMGVHGVQKLMNMDGTAQFFSSLTLFGMPLPQPELLAIITGAAEILIGVSMIVGFLTRLSGFGILLIAVGALLMVKLPAFSNPFAAGVEPGFSGEVDILLAGIGLLYLLIGGGGWGIDRTFRRKKKPVEYDEV